MEWKCLFASAHLPLVIPADYSGQLTILLRYPTPPSSNRIEGAPHHAILLLRQALALQVAPNPSTGATIVMENRTLLDIPLEVPAEANPPPPRRIRAPRSPISASSSYSSQTDGLTGKGHLRQSSSPAGGLSEMFTRQLVERGESLGINKTLMNAVTEIRVSSSLFMSFCC